MKKTLSLLLVASLLLACLCAALAEGRSLTVGMGTAPQNISPFTSFTNRQPIQQYLYEPLALKDPVTNEYFGVLAKGWTTEDYKTYHFEVYDNIFDTAGNQVKASDCVFSLEHGRDEAAISWIDSAAVTGEYTFDLTLASDSPSDFFAVIDRAVIVSQASYEAAADGMATSCVSTAPYMVTDFVPNVSITFEKNPNYWQTDEAVQSPLYKYMTVDKLAYTRISEASQQTIALETGAIDVFENIGNTEVANFLEGGRDYENFDALGYPTDTCYVLYFSRNGICGEDINLRKAISYGIDKEMLSLGAFSGLAVVPNFMGAMGGMSDLTPEVSGDYFPYDAALSADYLSKSTYSGQTLRLLVPNEPNHNKLAAIVQGYIMAAGIQCEIISYDNAMFQTSFADPDAWDVSICQMGPVDVAFMWSALSYKFFGGENGALGMGVKDEKLDELLAPLMTFEGHTVENATILCKYIDEMAYGECLINTINHYIVNKKLGIKNIPLMRTQLRYLGCAEFE